MKKIYIKKFIVFIFIFILLFNLLQQIFRNKSRDNEFLALRWQQYKQMDAPDILYMGSSPLMNSIYPIITWEKYGVTGLNLATSSQTPMTIFYQLKYALTCHIPKVVVLDLVGLTGDRNADIEMFEPTYRIITETIPDLKIKNELIKNIVTLNKNQDYASWFFPLLRYHDRWSELSQTDFDNDFSEIKIFPPYSYGAAMQTDKKAVAEDKRAYSETSINEKSKHWYDCIIKLCRENGIECVAVFPPVFVGNVDGERESKIKYCNEQGIPYIDYTTDGAIYMLGLDLETDYWDGGGHLNVWGGEKLSQNLGGRLVEMYDLKKHTEENIAAEWNAKLNDYRENFTYSMDKSEMKDDFSLYMKKVTQMQNCTIFITVCDEASYSLSKEQVTAMQENGLMDLRGYYKESYIAVIDDGKVISQMHNSSPIEHNLKIDNKIFHLVSAGGDDRYMESIQCDGQEYSVRARGFHIVIYDKSKHEIIDNVVFDTHQPM